ncbi:MAG: DUF1009 domain-containing protein [Proteobacteria bacterium]|nr:DUF1009 domain-containing protein [Pseudomonadota bacterium]
MTAYLPKLGILAGGGTLPALLTQSCTDSGRGVHIITFKGQPKPEGLNLAKISHTELPLGKVAATVATLRSNGVAEVVLAGHLSKPSFFDIRPDMKGAKVLAKMLRHHDDDLLGAVCRLLEEEGFKVVGVHSLLPRLLAGEGVLANFKPQDGDLADISLGLRVARALGSEDVGQGVIVKDKVIIGVEAVEGTDMLLQRCATLRGEGHGGVLVKVCKPGQDMRVDLPSIGPRTIENLAHHKFAGVAVEAGKTLILEPEETRILADKTGVFIYGFKNDGAN